MTIEIKNNKIKIGNLSLTQNQNLQVDQFNVYLNPGFKNNPKLDLLSSTSKINYLDKLNSLHDEINPSQDIFEVVALMSNNNQNNSNKLKLQDEMLNNRYKVHESYENLLKDTTDQDIVNKIENVSKTHLSFYENLEDIIFNISLTRQNYGNSVLNYFRGNKSYKIGKVIYWSNKFLNVDYDNLKSSTKSEFLDESDNKFYDFKNYIIKQEDQDNFIINDLLINQAISSRETIKQDYLDDTVEIVAQSLINLGRSLYLPVHTSYLTSTLLQKNSTNYNINLSKIKKSSKLSNYPIVRINDIPDSFGIDDNGNFIIDNFSGQINFRNSSLTDKFYSINTSKIKEDIINSLNIDYSADTFSGVEDNYFQKFVASDEALKFRFGSRKPSLFYGALSLLPDSVDTPIKLTYMDNKSKIYRTNTFDNSSSNEDTNSLKQFYNIDSDNEFKFSNFFEEIDLNRLFILVNNLVNNIKINKINLEKIDIDFIKNNLRHTIEKNITSVFGNSKENSLLNVSSFKENIFYDNNYFYNNFSKNLYVNQTKIKSTLNTINEDNINYNYVENTISIFKDLIHEYYPNSIFKNQYEFFKKIYKDFSSKKLENHISEKFVYEKDMFYSKILFNKNQDNNNVANIFFAKSLSSMLGIKLDNNIFEDQSFNIDVVFEGKNSDLLKSFNNFVVLNDAFEESGDSIKVYNINISPAGSFLTLSSEGSTSNNIDDFTIVNPFDILSSDLANTLEQRTRLERSFDEIFNEIRSDGYDRFIEEGVITQTQIDINYRQALAAEESRRQAGISLADQEVPTVVRDKFSASNIEERNFFLLQALDQENQENNQDLQFSFSNQIPTEYVTTDILPFNIDARINGLIFSKYSSTDLKFEKNINDIYNENSDLRNDQIRIQTTDNVKLFDLNTVDKNNNSPLQNLHKNEKKYQEEIFLQNNSTLFDVVFDTINLIIKNLVSDEELDTIKNQDDIINLVKNKSEIVSNINSLVEVYSILFKQTIDKVFYATIFDLVTQRVDLSNLNEFARKLEVQQFFVFGEFKEFFLKEIRKNRQISESIFDNQVEFNNTIDIENIHNFASYPKNDTDYKFIYTVNDYLIIKLFNILRRGDIARAAYFDIVYSYLEDTLNTNEKLNKISENIQDKIEKLENVTSLLLDNKNIIDMALLDNDLNQILRHYYETSIRHVFTNKKILEAKERENITDINFIDNILKQYHIKNYSKVQNDIDSKIGNSSEEKDVLCIAIPKNSIKNTNTDILYKISIGLADHIRPDLIAHERDYFYSPTFCSNSKMIPELCIGLPDPNFTSSLEIDFNNQIDKILFFNNNATQLKDKISLITVEDLEKILRLRLTNNNSLSNDDIKEVSKKMFNDYRNSGKIENILKEISNFPDKNQIFSNEIYQKDVVGNNTVNLALSIESQEFLSFFNENKNRVISNTQQVSDNLSEIIYDYEEASYNTKIYSFIKSFDKMYEQSDLRNVLEEKDYYDFYFIEISPNDFYYQSPVSEEDEINRYLGENNNIFEYLEVPNEEENIDYIIKGVDRGLKRKRDQDFSKNNYNYVVKIEEIK